MTVQFAGAAARRRAGPTPQRGGFAVGLIVGLLIGLALALGVALYIAKVPSPFHDKVPHRTPEQEAAEAEKMRNWDPNASLAGKPSPIPAKPSATPASAPPAPVALPGSDGKPVRPAPATAPQSHRDAAAILAGEPVPSSAPKIPKPGGEQFVYFVQVGAYSSGDDAEQQRAKLALQGFGAKVSEREQGGRTIHRVRLGPFDSQSEAASTQERLKSTGVDSALVRQERN
ncbi:SPOR domain-containing protein [Ideonella sp. DXS29W]|uniref:SPOR domain-containing protein n=1 Tax=Ideonella lacteola TaxID=2984193 RepID=A0ABU9BKV4_9BURK